MAESVFITGAGVVCPIGVGAQEVWSAVEAGRSGVRRIDDLADAGWIAPFGGTVTGFEAKRFVKPRKSLKVMADEIQWAFAAGEEAWAGAGLPEEPGAGGIDPERMGVVCGGGLMYCDMTELEGPYRACLDEQRAFDFSRWGGAALREFFPLWMLKYLPNMSACHIGIRRDARGPTNTMAHGDTSSLLALGEAAEVIRRGQADVMITGGSSRRLHMTDPLWHSGAGFWQSGEDPATACRPFDASRNAGVCGEGAAMRVLESGAHARRRGAAPLAEVLGVASGSSAGSGVAGGRITEGVIAGVLAQAMGRAGVSRGEIGSVNAHGLGTPAEDAIEARAIAQAVGDTPVTAPKSYLGNLGAAGGAGELGISQLGQQHGVTPATINHHQTGPDCPINVATDTAPTDKPCVAAVNYNTTGQAAAAILSKCEG
ncbi:MAG: beta-ketoacyl synthase N-terminal-like domain-containing protein [Planctomycetota bacterium]